MKKLNTTKSLVRTAVIAAIYTALTLTFAFTSYGSPNFRVSEALTILPLFCPEAIVGLTIGCFISNIFSPNPLIIDLVFGTLATLVAAICTFLIGKKIKNNARCFLGIIPPVVINALVVPFTFLALSDLKEAYLINVLIVGGGQALVLILLGIPLYFSTKKISDKLFGKLE